MSELHLMVVGYGLRRWARGEEAAADEMVVRGVDGVKVPMTTGA
jgi:hypothetical protein